MFWLASKTNAIPLTWLAKKTPGTESGSSVSLSSGFLPLEQEDQTVDLATTRKTIRSSATKNKGTHDHQHPYMLSRIHTPTAAQQSTHNALFSPHTKRQTYPTLSNSAWSTE